METQHRQPRDESAVDLAAVADCEEVEFVFRGIEGIDNPVIAYAEAVAITTSHAVVGIAAEPQAHVIDRSFDPAPNIGGKSQEDFIKRRVVNLQGAAHPGRINGFADAGPRPFRVRNG